MDTRQTLVAAALKILEEDGEATFSTRSVLAIAGVSAPTLYHHFGSADGMLDAAVSEAFRQFIARKQVVEAPGDARRALADGWNDYVRFAAERPRLYAAMLSRMLAGGHAQAARQAFEHLLEQLRAIEAEAGLATSVEAAADQMWAAANSGAMLHVTARLRGVSLPDQAVLERLRDAALESIFHPIEEEH